MQMFLGSCVLKISVNRVSVDTLGRYSADIHRHTSADTWPPLGQYFTDTRPTLRSFAQLSLLSSIFYTQRKRYITLKLKFQFLQSEHYGICSCKSLFSTQCPSGPQVALHMYSKWRQFELHPHPINSGAYTMESSFV